MFIKHVECLQCLVPLHTKTSFQGVLGKDSRSGFKSHITDFVYQLVIFLSSNEEERQLCICGCWWGSWYREPLRSSLCEWSQVETNGDNVSLGFRVWKKNESWWVTMKAWAQRKAWQSYRILKVTRGWEGTSQFRAWAISPDFILDEQMRVRIEGSSSGVQALSQRENLSFLSTSMSRPSPDRFVCTVVEVCGLEMLGTNNRDTK